MIDGFWTWYARIKTFKSDGKASFNKPLTILYALAHSLKGERWIEYNKDRDQLEDFLSSYSKFTKRANCLHPLWRLSNDNDNSLTFWKTIPNDLVENISGDISQVEAKEKAFKAGFDQSFWNWLREEPWRASNIIEEIIERTFTPSLEEPILADLGIFDIQLPTKTGELIKPQPTFTRDPKFRTNVLAAFENRCCFCDLKVLLGNKPIAMEAAHIKWKASGGECSPNNSLCLCPTHHTTLDLGLWSLDKDYRIIISNSSIIDYKTDIFFSKFEGTSIKEKPMQKDFLPSLKNLEWHHENIFRD